MIRGIFMEQNKEHICGYCQPHNLERIAHNHQFFTSYQVVEIQINQDGALYMLPNMHDEPQRMSIYATRRMEYWYLQYIFVITNYETPENHNYFLLVLLLYQSYVYLIYFEYFACVHINRYCTSIYTHITFTMDINFCFILSFQGVPLKSDIPPLQAEHRMCRSITPKYHRFT